MKDKRIRSITLSAALCGLALVLTGAALACLIWRNTRVLAAGGLGWLGVDLYYNATALGALGDLFNR